VNHKVQTECLERDERAAILQEATARYREAALALRGLRNPRRERSRPPPRSAGRPRPRRPTLRCSSSCIATRTSLS